MLSVCCACFKLITILSQVKACLFCSIACFISCMGQSYFPCIRNKKKLTDYNNACMTAEELGSRLVLFSQLSPLKQAFSACSPSHWPCFYFLCMSGISSTSELSYTASYSNCVCEYDLWHNGRYQTYKHAVQGLHFQVVRKQQNYIHVLHESVHEYFLSKRHHLLKLME